MVSRRYSSGWIHYSTIFDECAQKIDRGDVIIKSHSPPPFCCGIALYFHNFETLAALLYRLDIFLLILRKRSWWLVMDHQSPMMLPMCFLMRSSTIFLFWFYFCFSSSSMCIEKRIGSDVGWAVRRGCQHLAGAQQPDGGRLRQSELLRLVQSTGSRKNRLDQSGRRRYHAHIWKVR